jgi:tRNA pseudouridine32 synthase / 23S rRNA pseudouridine746 synthase
VWRTSLNVSLLKAMSDCRSTIALPGDISAWPTLLDFFAAKFPHVPRDTWTQRFHNKEIRYVVHGTGTSEPCLQNAIAHASDAPRAHAKLTYFRSVENETLVPFEERVLYQDDHILVADKPHFLPVAPSGRYVNETLLSRLKQRTGIATLAPAHRIDRETAGLVLFTIQPDTRDAYQSLFRDRLIEKNYEAIVPFRADVALPMTYRSRLERGEHFMQAITIEGEPNAETHIELIERISTPHGDFARLKLQPRTGARHQLRAQLSALGMPIVNDTIYPRLQSIDENARDDFSLPLQLLAKTLSFVDPITKAHRMFQSAQLLLV